MFKKAIMTLTLLIALLLVTSSVCATDNNTDYVVSVEEDIDISSVSTNYTNNQVNENNNVGLSNLNSSFEKNNDILGDSPPYNAYSVDVDNDIIIDYGSNAHIVINITPASSMYSYQYDFIVALYNYDGNQIKIQRYCGDASTSQETFYIDSSQLDFGTYFIHIINRYDDKLMDEATLYVKSSPFYTDYSAYVNDTRIRCGGSGNIIMDIVPASSTYYKYDFYLRVTDQYGNEKIRQRYYSDKSKYQETYTVNPNQLDPGIYTISLINVGDIYSVDVMSAAKLYVLESSDLKIFADNHSVTEKVKIDYTIKSKATGTLKVYLNNNYAKSVSVGTPIELGYLTEGNYVVKVAYGGDDHYYPSETEASFKIYKLMPSFSFNKNDANAGDDLIIDCSLNNDAVGTITVNGVTKQLVYGKANFTIPNIEGGTHQFNISYSGDAKYNPISKFINITIKSKEADSNVPQYSDFTYPEIDITDPYYKYSGGDIITYWTGNLNCYFNLYQGNKLIFKKYLTPGGSEVNTDDGFSEYCYLTKKLALGSYTVKITAPNGAVYTKQSFKVTKMPTYVYCPNVKYASGGTKYITVKVYDKINDNWATGTIKVKINGKTYKGKLKDGMAQIKAKLPSKKKTYTCKVIFLENSKFKSSSKTFKITVKKATNKKKTTSFTVVLPVKINQYTSKKIGKYKFRAYKYIEYYSNGRDYGIITTLFKNNKALTLNKYKTSNWWHFKSGTWKYMSKHTINYNEFSNVDKIKVKITIK